jgi:hypothetical protein
MKRTLCLALFGLLCCGLSVLAEDAAPAPLQFLAPTCAPAMTPAQGAPGTSAAPANFLVPEPRPTTSCSVNVLCRCGQVLRCTSAAGDCQRIPGCSVTCDGNEQVCPPCNGFGCF